MTTLALEVPQENEESIVDPVRVQALMRHYLRRMNGSGFRAADRSFAWIMCDPTGWVWGVVEPETTAGSFRTPYLVRYRGVLIGADNLEVSQPLQQTTWPVFNS